MAKKDQMNPEVITKEAREATLTALDALSEWRDEMSAANDRYSEKVFDQLATATEAMGMPADMVEATRSQFHSATKMQIEMMDKMVEAWEAQIKSPGAPMTMPANMFPQMPGMQGMSGMPGMPQMPGMPDMSQFGGMSMAPFQFWMQAADAWQKNYASAMAIWTNGAAGGKGR